MKKILLTVIFVFTLFSAAFAQDFTVKSLTELIDDTEGSVARKLDSRDKKCALIKVRTSNITADERAKFEFQGDAGTEVILEKGVGELKLFLTEGVKKLRIMHDEFGVFEYKIPIQIVGFKTYKMDIEVYKSAAVSGTASKLNISANYVEINVTPKDATVLIDDKIPVTDGSAYITIDEDHTLTVSKAMYHTHTQIIRASKNDKMVYDVVLKPAFGWMRVESKPENGAIIFIDGVEKGKTPYKSSRLESGEHTVKLIKEMYEPFERTVMVRDNDTASISFKMTANFAEVTIKVDDDNASIYVDGKQKGLGKWDGRLIAGTHIVEARREHHKSTMKEITCDLGEKITIKLDSPIALQGGINIKSTPTKARIIIDGKDIGKFTPNLIIDVIEGQHKIRLEKEGCAPYETTVTVNNNEMTMLDATLPEAKQVTIYSDSKGDKVYVNGKYVGTSPVTTNIAFGAAEIMVEHGSFKSTKNVTVTTSTNRIDVVVGASVTISTFCDDIFRDDDCGDDVIYVDGVRYSYFPIKLSIGKHKIETKRPGYTRRKTIRIKNNKSQTFVVNTSPHRHIIGYETSLVKKVEVGETSEKYAPVTRDGATYEWLFRPGPGVETFGIGWSLQTGVLFRKYNFAIGYGSDVDKIVYKNLDIPAMLKIHMGVVPVLDLWIGCGLSYSFDRGMTYTSTDGKDRYIDMIPQGFSGLNCDFDIGVNIFSFFNIGYTYRISTYPVNVIDGLSLRRGYWYMSFRFDMGIIF